MMKLFYVLFLTLLVNHSILNAQNNYLHFDGADDFALSNNTFNVDNTFTWEAQVLIHGVPQDFDGILTSHTPSPSTPQPQFSLDASGHVNASDDLFASGVTSINDGQWHHVALVVDGTVSRIYIDGVLDVTGTSTITGSHARFLAIGTERKTGVLQAPILLDEVRIWDVAHTQAQIQATMNTELTGNESNLLIYYNFNQGTCGGNNSTETTINDLTSNNNDATLNNFALTGCASNWVCGGATCGLADNNVSAAPPADVPTLSQWGLIILALMFMTMGTLYLIQPNMEEKIG